MTCVLNLNHLRFLWYERNFLNVHNHDLSYIYSWSWIMILHDMVKKMIWYPTRTMISSDAFLWIRFLYQSFSWYPKSWYLLISKIMNSPDTCGRSSWYLSRIILISVQDHEFSWYIWIIILLTVQDNKFSWYLWRIILISVQDQDLSWWNIILLSVQDHDFFRYMWKNILISVQDHKICRYRSKFTSSHNICPRPWFSWKLLDFSRFPFLI